MSTVEKGTDGISRENVISRPMPGPRTLGRNRDMQGVTTREKCEWPSGSNITELTLFVLPAAAPASMQAILPIYGKLVIDAASDALATALMTSLDSGTSDSGYIAVPLNQPISIPLVSPLTQGSLSGGRIDIQSSDGTTSLNWHIGAN